MRVLAGLLAVVATVALAPVAGAGDHETVGGGRWDASNSNGPCTQVEYGRDYYTVCAGSNINLPFGFDYIIVPLGNATWVECNTYGPNGQLFEHDIEHISDVPRRQQFWLERGWGVYEPGAMCQLW